KSREFGEESPQNSSPERATIALGQGASEEAHFEANSTMPKTDSSGCFGIYRFPFLKPGSLFEKTLAEFQKTIQSHPQNIRIKDVPNPF
ncbi:MAG: hypothetical protein KGI83_03795, partial [Verrucomicrobiota bacterium]|nr:hypothetical protein [Verrucomicrobiota bacterium]